MTLQEVKDYLKVTWIDEDANITGFIERGKSILNGLTGIELDYVNNALAKALLLDYCRYAYSNATEYFEENYVKEILRLQLESGISQLAPEVV